MEHDPTAIDPDEVRESQQEPMEDSGLQTPQPDQPIPTDQERFDQQQREAQKDSSPSPPLSEEDESASDSPSESNGSNS